MTAPLNTTPVDDDAGTVYVVLESADGILFGEVGRVKATSGAAAIRAYLTGRTDIDGHYNAVPVRSWKPVSVKTEIALKFGGET